ncbi:MAG: NIL domain-containing protein [Anaerolineales bacterium]|nr:MAG: NIL domain-containing protein [Anaerolineales bacterium]
MTEQVVRLIYPPAAVNTPVVTQLIRNFVGLTVNILQAQVNPTQGWLEVQLVGSSAIIESSIDWLRSQGIEVQVLGH